MRFIPTAATRWETHCRDLGMEAIWNVDGSLTLVDMSKAFTVHPKTGEQFYRANLHTNEVYDLPGYREIAAVISTKQEHPSGHFLDKAKSSLRTRRRRSDPFSTRSRSRGRGKMAESRDNYGQYLRVAHRSKPVHRPPRDHGGPAGGVTMGVWRKRSSKGTRTSFSLLPSTWKIRDADAAVGFFANEGAFFVPFDA